MDLVIPGEITFGNSYQDVVEYYGEPSKKVCKYNNEDLVTQADYELSNGIYISFSFEENLITSISVNIWEFLNKNSQSDSVGTKASDEAKAEAIIEMTKPIVEDIIDI